MCVCVCVCARVCVCAHARAYVCEHVCMHVCCVCIACMIVLLEYIYKTCVFLPLCVHTTQDAQEFLRCLLSQIHDELQLESLVGNTHENSTMSLNSSSSSSNSSQTQLVTAAEQPHPPVLSSTSCGIKDSPILRSLSRKNQKLQSSRQESVPDTFEPTSVVSVDDICVVERISHCITLHKPLAKISNQPKEECMDCHIQQQPKEFGRSDSERSLIQEGAPVCSCDHQPLHPDRESEGARQPDEVQDMETTQGYDKSTATAATVKKRILEETNKSVLCVCVRVHPCVLA